MYTFDKKLFSTNSQKSILRKTLPYAAILIGLSTIVVILSFGGVCGDGDDGATTEQQECQPTDTVDTDNDGIFDSCDPDDDNDGILDTEDSCPHDATNTCGNTNTPTSDTNTDKMIEEFYADPSTIDAGQSSFLRWKTNTNAISCSIIPGDYTAPVPSGEIKVSPVSSTQYTLQCEGNGKKETATTTLTVVGGATSGWSKQSPAGVPPDRESHALAYDSKRLRAVLFGGAPGTTPGNPYFGDLDDTWEWDGSNWIAMTPQTIPEGRYYHGMAYDKNRERTVMFGGVSYPYKQLNDTWEWNGTNWENISVVGPSSRDGLAMAYDENRAVIVLFGGYSTSSSTYLNDTWEYNGTIWKKIVTTNQPSPRTAHAMTYDAKKNEVLLFGGGLLNDDGSTGQNSDGTYNASQETWAYNGSWRLAASEGPSPRSAVHMAYDASKEVVILYGGMDENGNALADTWEWNGSGWKLISLVSGPPPLRHHAMVFDNIRNGVLLFGGYSQESGYSGATNDTWLYSAQGYGN